MASPRKFLLLAKKESTQFTDASPVPATNSVLIKNPKFTPLKVESEDRALIRSYLGNSEQLLVMEEAMFEFDVELQSSGALGTAPAWGELMKGCAMAETIVASTSVTYNPVSSAFDSLTLYVYRDGVLYKGLGCQGTFSIDAGAKKIPHIHFSFKGKYSPVTDTSLLTGVYTAWKTPVASIAANTGTTTVGGYAAKIAAFSLDMANDVSHNLWMNGETLGIVDRKPKGSMTVEAVTIASKDYPAAIRAATSQALVWTHGVTSTFKVVVSAPAMQLVDIDEVDFNGTLAYKFNLTFNPSSGNDEVSIQCI